MITATLNETQVLPSADSATDQARKIFIAWTKRLRAYARKVFTVTEKHRKLTEQPHWGNCW